MAGRRWGVALLVLGGIAIGVAVAGVPSRGEDPPLRVDASVTSVTSTTSAFPTMSPTGPGGAP